MSCIPQQNSVAKGPILYCLDELSKRQDAAERLDALRTGLQQLESRGYQHLNDVLAAYLFPGVYEDPRKIAIFQAYLDDYWFNERKATAEFREHQPVAPTFVAGVIKTISLALNEPTPKTIDAWWVVDHPRFEMINFVTANGVTLLLATPRPRVIVAQGILNANADAWITHKGGTDRVNHRAAHKSQLGRIEAAFPILP